jgi:1,2-dihydroxy-3-keto-5-methylthiopentene dioxygenase
LTVFRADTQTDRIVAPEVIAARLATRGVAYARWPVAAHDTDPTVGYAAEIAAVAAEYGYQSHDVVRLTPDNPNAAAARQKFLAEHTHADDEARFFAVGAGTFYLHYPDSQEVLALSCTAGDFVRVPAGTQHWFDMGEAPFFAAIRWFTIPDGWVATFTGSPVATRHPTHDTLVAP